MFIKNIRADFYDVVIKDKVLVLVNFDVDAICALRILQFLFETDNVQYTVVSVSTRAELNVAYETHKTNVKSIIMINIGAIIDVIDEIIREDDTGTIPSRLTTIDVDPESSEFDEAIRKIENYRKNNFYGDSTAVNFFKLAWKMSKDSNYLLWLAILGVYDQFINCKTDPRKFENYVTFLQSHVTRLNHVRSERVGGALNDIVVDGDNVQPRSHTLEIAYTRDLHLSLYRNWSLFESMRHAPQVLCKFKVWTPRGEKRLLEFFAELGIPLTQCKQRYAAMDLEYRKNVYNWIQDLSSKYDLADMSCDGFVASRGFNTKYAAYDFCLAVKALMESPESEKSSNEKFLDALNALSLGNCQIFEKGLELAKHQLSACVRLIQHILDMNAVGFAGPYLYVVIKESAPDVKYLTHTGALLSVAIYLHRAFIAKTKLKNVEKLPFVIISPDSNRPGLGYVAGLPPHNRRNGKNFFAALFRKLIDEKQISFEAELDFYDSCILRFPYKKSNIDLVIQKMKEAME